MRRAAASWVRRRAAWRGQRFTVLPRRRPNQARDRPENGARPMTTSAAGLSVRHRSVIVSRRALTTDHPTARPDNRKPDRAPRAPLRAPPHSCFGAHLEHDHLLPLERVENRAVLRAQPLGSRVVAPQ